MFSLLCVFVFSLPFPSLVVHHRVWSSHLILTGSPHRLAVQQKDAVTTMISDHVTRGSYVAMWIYWLLWRRD
jgi:hypothetical protein